MKEHLRKYFPQRFPDDSYSLSSKVMQLFKKADNVIAHSLTRNKCELRVIDVFTRSNEMKLLVGAMKKYGCNFNLARHVSCEDCYKCIGGFDPDTKQIIVCKNNYLTTDKVFNIMLHEMIHMFDYCRANFDFDNLRHVACSEIRAANLTFCSITDSFSHGSGLNFQFKNAHQYCVKEVAFESVKAYSPETPDQEVWKIIDDIFPGCYNDLEPFGRRPLNGSQNFRHSYRERYLYGYA